jgi:hypothetical protein
MVIISFYIEISENSMRETHLHPNTMPFPLFGVVLESLGITSKKV